MHLLADCAQNPNNLMSMTSKGQQLVLALQEKYYQMIQESMTKTNEFFQQQQSKCAEVYKSGHCVPCFDTLKQAMDAQYQYAQKMIELANRISHESLDVVQKAYTECKTHADQCSSTATGAGAQQPCSSTNRDSGKDIKKQ